MNQSTYVPERGDVIWIDLDPAIGHEQSGRRPVLVLSPRRYHNLTGLLFMCPLTRRAKHYSFEVEIPPGLPFAGGRPSLDEGGLLGGLEAGLHRGVD